MVPAREAAWNSFFFREERSWGSWQHPSSLPSLRPVPLLLDSGRTMGVNKQLARWCLSKGVGFVDNWNFSLGINQWYRSARLHFNQAQADRLLAQIITFAFFFFPSPFFSTLLSSPKPADADSESEKQRSPRATKNIVPKTRSRKAWCYLFGRYPHLHPRRRVNTQVITKCHATATASAIIT